MSLPWGPCLAFWWQHGKLQAPCPAWSERGHLDPHFITLGEVLSSWHMPACTVGEAVPANAVLLRTKQEPSMGWH